jgi:endonuclease-3
MSGENRTAIIGKLVKVAKKHYPVVSPPASRSVLENLLYACLLENSSFAAADEAFARLEQYADWNEVRVTTAQELCEISAALTDPQVAIERLKLALHSIFEIHYSFDLDFLINHTPKVDSSTPKE